MNDARNPVDFRARVGGAAGSDEATRCGAAAATDTLEFVACKGGVVPAGGEAFSGASDLARLRAKMTCVSVTIRDFAIAGAFGTALPLPLSAEL